MYVRPKKALGQHFLKDQGIAERIVDALLLKPGKNTVLEIGPGTGVLTQFLSKKENIALTLSEVDRESIEYLKKFYPALKDNIVGDFLELDLTQLFKEPINVIGNFPYNISSQIFFKALDHKDQVVQIVGMLQKEVADRIASKHGNKIYGILSVLLQAYYDIEYLFKVPPGVFNPPPKVMSAVIRLTRNDKTELGCDEMLFRKVVKQGFNNRRKTLRNSLKPLNLPAGISSLELLDKRAEQLSVNDFISLTKLIEESGHGVR